MKKNRLRGMTTYLIGPMEYSENCGEKWRKLLSDVLRYEFGIGVYSPCDKACNIGMEGKEEIVRLDKLREKGEYDQVVNLMKDVVRTDLSMVDRSDFVIVYLDTSIYTCGSYIEIAWAAMERKPILIVCKQGKSKIPGFLWGLCGGHSTFFDNFSQLEDYLYKIANTENLDTLNGRWKFFDTDKIFYRIKDNNGH